MTALLFRNATLLPGGTDWAPRPGQDLLLRDRRIVAIGPALAAPGDARILPGASLLLLPGFRNGHTHSPEALFRGRATTARLDAWLAAAYGDGADSLNETALFHAVRMGAADTIRGGGTGVTDHLRQIPQRLEAVAAVARAWAETGLSCRIAPMLRDRALPHGLEAQPLGSLLELAAACLSVGQDGVVMGIGPSAPQRCSDALLRGLHQMVRAAGGFLHLHVCETAQDAAACRALYGRSAIAHLEGLGLLGPETELAHGVHLDDEDLARLAGSGTVLVHNPLANLRLGSGTAPIARALARGVRVRLGTDGAASNDSQSMLEVTKMACLLPRATRPEEEWPSPEEALAMATAGATLAPGEPADLLAFDRGAPAFAGSRPPEIAARLVLAARETDLVHVVARGRMLMEGRHLAALSPMGECA